MMRPLIYRLEKRELQRLFNREILSRVLCGELVGQIESEGQPQPAVLAQEPPGTRSQTLSYWDESGVKREFVTTIHRYRRPDGKIGQSGLPDPKQLVYNGHRFALEKPIR
jgi:hypothetical protein